MNKLVHRAPLCYRRNVQDCEFVLKLHIYSKIIFLQNKYTYNAYQYWEKVSKKFHIFCLYLWLSTIMNLIFHNVRLGNFMTSCKNKLYHRTVSNRIKLIFLIILFGKISSSESLPSSGTESEFKEWLISKNLACNHTLLNRKNQRFQLLKAEILRVM